MKKNPIKWAILGTSFISEVMAKAIQASATSELIAIGSRSAITAKTFSDKFSIPKYYDDYHKLLADPEIDAVYIGLPNHLHKEWMMHCANARKNILCEKPFVISIDEAHEVINVIANANVFCMEALMYRSHPFIKKLQEIMQSKMLGDLKLFNATYTAHIADVANATAGGSIRNLGCYPISLVRLLANAEPKSILGTGRINHHNQTDNQASVLLTFPDDVIAVVSTADDIKMSWQFDVYGTKGRMQVITNPWLPEADNKALIFMNNEATPIEISVQADKPLYTYQIDAVNNQIRNRNQTNFDGFTLSDSLANTVVLETWRQQITEKLNSIAMQKKTLEVA